MKQMNMGMYEPMTTYIHELDARVKVIATVLMMTLLFSSSSFLSYTLIACFLLGLTLSARLPLKQLGGLSAWRVILVLTFLLNMFLTPGETIWVTWRWIDVTVEGVQTGLLLVARIVLMVLTTTILTLTTKVLTLTSALAFLASPLKKLRFPVAEGVLIIHLALRFVPTLIEEKDRIISAQKARGASFEAGSILKKAYNMIPILIPLMIASLKRAEDLAHAMEARSYQIGALRTSFHEMKMTKKDYTTLLVIFLFFAGMVGLECFIRR